MADDFLSFKLSDDFIAPYKTRKVDWGFPIGGGNSLGELTYITKYSRLKENGKKERWWETCRRVIEGMYSILKDHCKENRTPWNEMRAQNAAKDAYDRLFTFKWTPPGRGLWAMGTEMVNGEHNSASLYNCFAGETEIITDEGARPIASLAGMDVSILSTGGQWVTAPIKSFGAQKLMKVTFQRQGVKKEVYATADHRWFVKDKRTATRPTNSFREVYTKDLSSNHRVQEVFGQGIKNIQLSPFGVAHGFAFGDGTNPGSKRVSGRVYLCGDKDKALLPYFEHCPERQWSNGNVLEISGLPRFFKSLPDINESKTYLYGWLAGYFAADGNVSNGQVTLSSTSKETLQAVRDICYVLGVGTYGVRAVDRISNLTGEPSTLYSITFMGDTLTEEFFLLDSHRLSWLDHPRASRSHWNVVSVEETNRFEEVFCAVVPEKHAFTLSDNILTGNCSFISTDKISSRSVYDATFPFVRLMEQSMHGIGVGFDVLGAGNLTIHQPKEDERLTYVIPDSREGWCESLGVLLESYFFKGRARVEFDYSEIRPAGAPIKRFGGVAAGPGPLQKMHEQITKLLDGREGELITSMDILDIQNLAGKAVVAGNIRRSAELALGPVDDKAFLDAKNWEVNPERMGADGWGHLSNNSLIVRANDVIEDFVVDRIALNGEPGVFNINLARKYGRLVDPANNKDEKVMGLNPCGEISLESNEVCNLTETFPFRHEDVDDFLRTLKCAYLYSKAVTLLPTPWAETNEVVTRNRRIGTSVSGVAQFVEHIGWHELKTWLDLGYEAIQKRDKQYSEWLGVRESIKTTTTKPSGTVSILCGATPGVHWPVSSGTYIRRQRFRVGDPVVDVFAAAGYDVEPDVMDPEYTVVISFPTTGPSIRNEKEVSVWEKVSLAAVLQKYWADNAVSATFTFSDEEKGEIGPILRAFADQLKSLSFLPISEGAYKQMPYESISEEQAEEMVAKVSKINWKPLYDGKNAVDAQDEKFCTNDTCTI